jgi:NitT/TauT family transport system substrate-binding protein
VAPGGRGGATGTGGAPGSGGARAGHAGGNNGDNTGEGAGSDLNRAGASGATSLAGGGGSGGGSGSGGASTIGAAAGHAGTTHASGGAASYPDLRFAGLVSALELAPLRLATNGSYPGKVTITSGGVDALCGSSPTADIATNAETQFLRATGGSDCDKVRVIFTMCEGLYRIVAKKSAGITTLADLAGKRVMAPSGASSAYYLTRMLSAAGLAMGSGAGQVNVVSGNPSGSTFDGSSAPDAATIWEPGIEQAAEALGSDAVVFQHDASDEEVYRELFDLHTTTDVLANAAKRRAVVELVRDLIAASATLRADPTAANSLLTGPAGVGASVLTASMKYERFAGTLVPDLLDVMTEEEPWRASIDNRSARSRDDLAKYIDTSVLADAMSGM